MTVLLSRTDSTNKDFIALVKELDADLAVRDGEDHAFYDQFNKIDMIKFVVVLYVDGIAVACGAFKPYDESVVEIKRMYCKPEWRGNRFAAAILNELEKWAAELSYHSAILETGIKQHEAIRLYERYGYHRMENYGQYAGIKTSICMKRAINEGYE
jgi:GNAT superfamily N-acetyltransferase